MLTENIFHEQNIEFLWGYTPLGGIPRNYANVAMCLAKPDFKFAALFL
ncbi:hypothetical protein EMA8858_00239 [Emticicia aquatica]|jgi:hypothetical protein|uniref:Uncharacterized protein n=1 Tax=Emticicia aquatica TaxID=1681835 RepID=A0ABM9AK69_9BACT|nr:hypothetical protein EMA8858_00239 [Emticicia aquatica]